MFTRGRSLDLVKMAVSAYLIVLLVSGYAGFYSLIPIFPFFAIALGNVVTDISEKIFRNRYSIYHSGSRNEQHNSISAEKLWIENRTTK